MSGEGRNIVIVGIFEASKLAFIQVFIFNRQNKMRLSSAKLR